MTSQSISLRFLLILFFHLCLSLSRGLLFSSLHTKTLYAFIFSVIYVLNFLPISSSLLITKNDYKPRSSFLCGFLQCRKSIVQYNKLSTYFIVPQMCRNYNKLLNCVKILSVKNFTSSPPVRPSDDQMPCRFLIFSSIN